MKLEGRVAVISGAANGMGASHARELASQGARLGVADVEEGPLHALARSIRSGGGEVIPVVCDVRDSASVDAFVSEVATTFGRLDIVIANAGIADRAGGIAQTTDAQWREQFDVHTDGAFRLVRASVPWLIRSQCGRVILISSEWAQVGPGFAYGYCAAKGALLAFGRNLAVELAPHGVRVNMLTPGTIATRMTADEDLDAVAASIPLGRVGDPRDVSQVVSFLASDEAGYITGQTIAVNGGAVISGM